MKFLKMKMVSNMLKTYLMIVFMVYYVVSAPSVVFSHPNRFIDLEVSDKFDDIISVSNFEGMNNSFIDLKLVSSPEWINSSFAKFEYISKVKTLNIARSIINRGDYCYIADSGSCLTIVDVSNKTGPVVVANLDTGDFSPGIFLVDELIYLADGAGGLRIIDVTNASEPLLIGTYDDGGENGRDVTVQGNYAYLANLNNMKIIDISNSTVTPQLVSVYDSPGEARGIFVEGDYVYLPCYAGGFLIFDISNVSNPIRLGSVDRTSWPRRVIVRNDVAYVASYYDFEILNVTNKTGIEILAVWETCTKCWDLDVSGSDEVAFLADDITGVHVIDITDKEAPVLIETVDTEAYVQTVHLGEDNFVYVGDTDDLKIYKWGDLNLNGTVPSDACGNYDIQVEATDIFGETVIDTFSIVVSSSSCVSCYGESDPGIVCSGHGECSTYNNCTCEIGWVEEDCSLKSFFALVKGDLYTISKGDPSSGEYTCDLSTSRPSARSRGLAFNFADSKSYIFGGYGIDMNGDDGLLNDVFKLNEGDNTWCFVSGSEYVNTNESDYSDTLEFSPSNNISSRSDFAGFSSTLSFFVFGGRVGVSNETNELWEFHIGTANYHPHEWRILMEENNDEESLSQPSKRMGSCAGRIDPFSMFIFGGHQSRDEDAVVESMKNDLWIYDAVSNEFVLIMNGTYGSIINGSEYIGDYNLTFGNLTSLKYDVSLVPYHRTHHLCWVDSVNNFIVFGGTLLNSKSSSDLWMFNDTLNLWSYVSGDNTEEMNSIGSYYDYSIFNSPSVRSGSILFRRSHDFHLNNFGNDEVLFFGGMSNHIGSTTADVWAFSNSLLLFKFVNGTDPMMNHGNRGIYDISSRAYGLGILKESGKAVVISGEIGLKD